MCICLTLDELNNFDLLAGEIENANLSPSCCKKVWMQGGDYSGHIKCKVLVIFKVLYGLKSSGEAFCAFLAERLDDIGFKSSIVDQDVWMRPARKASCEDYYKYILCYINDIICISAEPSCAMDEKKGYFEVQE